MPDLPIRRNTALLSASMALNSAVFQLVAAVSSITFVLVTGIEGLLGLGPAIFLVSSACGSLVSGRAMDRFGRVPVIATGFAVTSVGSALTALGAATASWAGVVPGFALLGAGAGTAALARTAAGDMYPAARRARGIAWVLFGSVFGAILGPAVFSPIFAGKDVETAALVVPWLAASGIALLGIVVVLLVRPDPMRIAQLIAPAPAADEPTHAAPLREILRRPGVVPALVASLASIAVMVSVMNLTGYVVVEHRHHAQHVVFPIIAAHVLGMFGLVPVVGTLVDRIGRAPALVGGLAVIAVSCAGLQWGEGVWATGVLLFGLGLGWNVSYVAASAQLVDLSRPTERGKLLGFGDFSGSMLGAAFVLLGGYALDELGVYALAFGAAAAALLPVGVLLTRTAPPPVRTEPA
ncbi:MAG TPA: MFS transporter [Gaiellaceae bacterium]|nr:MFS transporter [Gaiellaceae bacterium]